MQTRSSTRRAALAAEAEKQRSVDTFAVRMQTRSSTRRAALAAEAEKQQSVGEALIHETAPIQHPTLIPEAVPIQDAAPIQDTIHVKVPIAQHPTLTPEAAPNQDAAPIQDTIHVKAPMAPISVRANTKAKRTKGSPAQPVKGAWVVPHGMGTLIAPSNGGDDGDGSGPDHVKGDETTTEVEEDKTIVVASSIILPTAAAGPRRLPPPIIKRVKEEDYETDEEDHKSKKQRTVQTSTQIIVAQPPTPKLLVFIKGAAVEDGVAKKRAEKKVQGFQSSHRMILRKDVGGKYGLTGFTPYPYWRFPTPEMCEEVYRILADMHGECMPPKKMPAASLEVAGCGEVPCVLDALLRTLISGYTLMARADAAIRNLADHYGIRDKGTGKGSIDWEKVRLSSEKELAGVIMIAGDGAKRSRFIKQILEMVYQENKERLAGERNTATAIVTEIEDDDAAMGVDDADQIVESQEGEVDLLSLDHMHKLDKGEALRKFVQYPGIGVKTAACVTLFCLQRPCFAVDTHVERFCNWLGWVPPNTNADNCFRHADAMVPDHLKYGLHQLFIRHGQICFKCHKATKPGTKEWNEAPDCPLEGLLTRNKQKAGSGKGRPKETSEETSED